MCEPGRPGEPDQPCIGGADYTGITDYLVSPVCGTSLDCNANDVPDECEYRGYFDGDGLTDLRDLSALQRCFTGHSTALSVRTADPTGFTGETIGITDPAVPSSTFSPTATSTCDDHTANLAAAWCRRFECAPFRR